MKSNWLSKLVFVVLPKPFILCTNVHLCVSHREKDLEAQKGESKTFEDRLENLRQQLLGERNKNLKNNKEVAEVVGTRKLSNQSC